MTFAEAIEAEAGQKIIACVIRNEGGRICEWSSNKDSRDVDPSKCGIVLPWSEARALLDYKWDSGFGSQDCHDIHAWSKDRVLYVHEYDGSTTVTAVPRNPSVLA